MRLAEKIVVRTEETFGTLKFSAFRRDVFGQDDNGNQTDEVLRRTYDLKSTVQGRMIQVSLPASVPKKDFPYNAVVEIINPEMGAFVTGAGGLNPEAEWTCSADDIVLKRNTAQGGNTQQGQNGAQPPQNPQRKDEKKD